MNVLRIKNLEKSYENSGSRQRVLKDLSLDVKEEEFLTVVGPSGCGKTTLLKCIAGLKEPESGEIIYKGEEENSRPKVSLLFQEYNKSLLYWKTIEENVAFGLEKRDLGREEKREIVKGCLRKVKLAKHKNKYPYELSGGMQQNAALARILAYNPQILLMDEPFGSLDAQTKLELQNELLRLWRDLRKTILYVTHDIAEAIYLSDRVLVMTGEGKIQEKIKIELDRPRDELKTKKEEKFEAYRNKIYKLLQRGH